MAVTGRRVTFEDDHHQRRHLPSRLSFVSITSYPDSMISPCSLSPHDPSTPRLYKPVSKRPKTPMPGMMPTSKVPAPLRLSDRVSDRVLDRAAIPPLSPFRPPVAREASGAADATSQTLHRMRCRRQPPPALFLHPDSMARFYPLASPVRPPKSAKRVMLPRSRRKRTNPGQTGEQDAADSAKSRSASDDSKTVGGEREESSQYSHFGSGGADSDDRLSSEDGTFTGRTEVDVTDAKAPSPVASRRKPMPVTVTSPSQEETEY